MFNCFSSYRIILLLFLCIATQLHAQEKRMTMPQQNDIIIQPEQVATDVIKPTGTSLATLQLLEQRMNQQILNASNKVDSTVITLPVVFHIIDDNPATIPDIIIINALKNLNDAFSKSGVYSASVGADSRIRFCFANKDPDGGITSGITRTQSFLAKDLNPLIEDVKLKDLIVWDPARYINIWYIRNMHYEILPRFHCGNWIRMFAGGYATMPPGGGFTDGIVVTAFGNMLAHEMGHYLGLYHTFEGLNCSNFDCNLNGDRVCDTPPDATVNDAPSCSMPTNSCTSDTLSGFTVDVPDQITNFMDYGNEACHNEFTEGQSVRMRAAIATQRNGLLDDKCNAPCASAVVAAFTADNPYPIAGATINFTNTSTGATNYEWLVNNVVVATTTDYSTSFPAKGKYKVTLKAYDGASCFAIQSSNVFVNCGVIARFYTNKRQIASKSPEYLDSIRFTNTSVGATSVQWLISNDRGMAPQVVSTANAFNYVFTDYGNYRVQLIATNGSCSDTTNVFTIPVADPTADGTIFISSAECHLDTKLRVSYYICNNGYAPMPKGVLLLTSLQIHQPLSE